MGVSQHHRDTREQAPLNSKQNNCLAICAGQLSCKSRSLAQIGQPLFDGLHLGLQFVEVFL
jgi:hypothetical protein